MERKNAFRSCKVIPALILLCLFLACLVISPCVRAVITHDVIFVMNGYGTAPAETRPQDLRILM